MRGLASLLAVGGGLLLLSKLLPSTRPDYNEDYQGDDLEQEPTLSRQRMAVLADEIEEALLGGSWSEDEDASTAAILQCVNDADVAGLVSIFGVRKECDLCMEDYTLPRAVVRFYSPSQRYALNAALAQKGITFTF